MAISASKPVVSARPLIGLLGGTFDPVHIGHLRLALELKQRFSFEQMRLLPCHRPPHREAPSVDSRERARLVQLALTQCPELILDDRELHRERPSYTVETLEELRAELGPDVSLCWVLGSDAFAGLDTWHRWQELLDLAHLIVLDRPEAPLPEQGALADWLQTHSAPPEQLANAPQGSIVRAGLRRLSISATEIRALIAQGSSAQFLVPDAVWQYIVEHKLYRTSPIDL